MTSLDPPAAVQRGSDRAARPDGTGQRSGARQPATAPVAVLLLRHGEVNNPRGILYGRLPGYPLSDLGRRMAAGVAAALTDAGSAQAVTTPPIRYLVASPLQRAVQTAEPIAQATGLPLVLDERLIEADNVFEGSRFTPAQLRKPANWPRLVKPTLPSWGEPYLDIARRMLAALYEAVDTVTALSNADPPGSNAADPSAAVTNAAAGDVGSSSTDAGPAGADISNGSAAAVGGTAVLVSHQLPIWTLRRFLAGQRLWHNPARRECALASLTSFTFTDGVLGSIGYQEPVARLSAQGRGTGA